MPFKTKQQLFDDKFGANNGHPEQVEVLEMNSYQEGLDVAFKESKERAEFYNKYWKSSMELYDDHPELYAKYAKETRFVNTMTADEVYREYLNWLINYCFGDMI